MIQLVLIAALVIAVRCAYLLRYPWGPCPRCKGRKVNKGSTGKRWGMCRRCAGTGQRQRFGARAVHRFFWSVAGAVLHERFRKRIGKAREKGGYPEL